MRIVVQRVRSAVATTLGDGGPVGTIAAGLVVFVGFGRGDGPEVVDRYAAKLAYLRIFESEGSKFGRSAVDTDAQILTISQFTLYADTSRGRRPSFSRAADPEVARQLYERFAEQLASAGVQTVVAAPFQSRLQVDAVNWGPFTIILDSHASI